MIEALATSMPPGPDRRNKIQKMIDDEIYSAQDSKKRLLADFMVLDESPVDKQG